MRYKFVTTVSHKLRTPITEMKWGLSVLSDELNEKGIRGLTIIDRLNSSSNNISEIIEELIEFASIDVNDFEREKEDVAIEELVSDAVKNQQFYLTKNKI